MGLILLILLLIMRLEKIAIDEAKTSIGRKAIGLKEKWKFSDRALPTSKFAIKENTNSSTQAITKETRH